MKMPVLVVENDPGNRFTLHELIALQGYSVASVGSGAEALRILPMLPPGIVVLDYRMPYINGGDVMRFIAADPEMRRCQAVILVTASPHDLPPSVFALLDDLGASVLPKPFITETLPDALAAAAQRLGERGCHEVGNGYPVSAAD
jgi:CheY-like chemotaxis protein